MRLWKLQALFDDIYSKVPSAMGVQLIHVCKHCEWKTPSLAPLSPVQKIPHNFPHLPVIYEIKNHSLCDKCNALCWEKFASQVVVDADIMVVNMWFDLKYTATKEVLERDLTKAIHFKGWEGHVSLADNLRYWEIMVCFSVRYRYLKVKDVVSVDMNESLKGFWKEMTSYFLDLDKQFNWYFNAIWC